MTDPVLPPAFRLTDSVALVTGAGAADGIGFATARLLAALGAHVAVAATTTRIHDRAADLSASGVRATGHIAEAAELAVDNINLRAEAVRRADELRSLADVSRMAVEELRVSYRDLQVATRLELETMTHTIEGLYVHLGLTNSQEFTISDTVRGAVDRVLTLFEDSSKLDSNFAGIVEGLTRAGEYTGAQEDEAMPTVELW